MASLPSQRPAAPSSSSQRRPTSPTAVASSSTQTRRTSSFSNASSVDSQTVLLNNASSTSHAPPPPVEAAPQPDFEPRKCWICFNDETEDDENSSEWRSPCPCVLVAHEKCLLDWIADMEAPSGRRRAGAQAGKIHCPQCKGEIVLQRPKSTTVEMVRLVEQLTGTLLVPGFVFLTATAAYSTLRLAGLHTIYEIFGREDGVKILAPLYMPPTSRAMDGSMAQRFFRRLTHHWRLDFGLPVIPAVLIASRTSLADSFLPLLPLVFFASSDAGDELLQLSWPPSAAFTIAALPYARGLYNAYYERVWAPRERRWLKEIQPRAGVDEEVIRDDPPREEHNHMENVLNVLAAEDELEGEEDGEEVLEVELDLQINDVGFDIFAGWNNGGEADNHQAAENPPVPIARGPAAPPMNVPPQQQEQQADHAAAPALNVPLQPAQPRRQRARRDRAGFTTTVSIADAILGALVFPSIAAAVGEALRYALPASWVTPPAVGKPTGFLQAKWGRSILGGCLFVGIKDAVYLYVRWKMAQNHRRRSVLDYDKSMGRSRTRNA